MHDLDRGDRTSETGSGALDVNPFSYEVTEDARRIVISMHGELDLAAAPELRTRLLQLLTRPITGITLDMTSLTFLDSSGLAVLNRARQEAEDRGIQLRLAAVPDHARRVLDVTAMGTLFVFSDDEPAVQTS